MVILRGDARALPLPDESVDLIATSVPYYALRSYTDDGEHYEGQIGDEPTPAEYLTNLLDCTREWARVLKPGGSMFIECGDKYDNGTSTLRVNPGTVKDGRGQGWNQGTPRATFGRAKSLMLLPERYRIAVIDELGLIVRAVVIRHMVNGLPESVTDRTRRAHVDFVHLTKQPRYFSAIDEIREPPANPGKNYGPYGGGASAFNARNASIPKDAAPYAGPNPLGRLPGSVWDVTSEPLIVPDHVAHARCCGGVKQDGCDRGLTHYAAWPPSLVRRIILGWSPSGICTVCGEGRRPVVHRPGVLGGDNNPESRSGARRFSTLDGGQKQWDQRMANPDRIVGYACACTPFRDYPERRRPSVTPSRNRGRGHQDNDLRAGVAGSRHHGDDWPKRQPVREYDLENWTPPPTRPALVLDPFGGSGTTALVASVLGRTGISIDRSADYGRLATWRVNDPAQRARALKVPKPAPVPDDQLVLDLDVA